MLFYYVYDADSFPHPCLRCLELEGVREGLDGQVKALEGEVGDVKAALSHSQEECRTHHSSILRLQREVGRLQGG